MTDRLPRQPEAERHLIICIVGWPDRASEIVPLVAPDEFVDEIHQKVWRVFKTQLLTTGTVDCAAAGKKVGCSAYLLECGYNASTTAYAEVSAKKVREAARARRVHDICQRGADAILNASPADSVIAQLRLALNSIETGAAAR